MSIDSYYAFRGMLIERLRRDLLGPATEDEVIDDPPATRYIVGILFPQPAPTGRRADPTTKYEGRIPEEQDIDECESGSGEEFDDPPVALANVKYPSSMGLTFAVNSAAVQYLQASVSAARYVASGEDEAKGPIGPWTRESLGPVSLRIDTHAPSTSTLPTGIEGLDLFVRVRNRDSADRVAVTLVLVNAQTAERKLGDRDRASFFQPKINVHVGEGPAAIVERPGHSAMDDGDLKSYSLLYRHAREFAVGHGCSVRWTVGEDPSSAMQVETEFIPSHELRLAESNPMIESSGLSMEYLKASDRAEVCERLDALCSGYEAWISERGKEVETWQASETVHKDVAIAHLESCRTAATRMRSGVDLLRSDALAWKSFQHMNEAMLQQRARTVWMKSGKAEDEPSENATHKWYPFQIAFILICLPGLAKPQDPNSGRDIADLLWFPTGGGKTEAYLGLVAFAVFHRRLSQSDGGGVTALMRYTLRLLTIQQFERAALLICCCERIRANNAQSLGSKPISVGMWLGQDATPNTIAQARTALNKLHAGADVQKSNPVQLHTCPWCGHRLDHTNYWIRRDASRLMISCGQPGCAFRDGLPAFVVDEDVYRHRPTLIIATADKFAGLPWRDASRALFNRADGLNGEQPAPELIIQDELHLISGPLGTLAGLYETAVDELATDNGIRPKVIASTATIRRAQDQTRALFDRRMEQFPPPALDGRDSYFAVEAAPEDKGTRLYLGLLAPSTSHTTLLVRTYASLLQATSAIQASDEVKDQYWTLVGYFNSLRVLGGARMQVQDDVDDRMELLANQSEETKREIEPVVELTSRMAASEIPGNLKHISVPYGTANPRPVDVVLATNMISVGVDVDRLGLMAVMGQPQSTSEYIQSTSRVGRRHPGLVVDLLNAARSRDRSHYESFVAYHAALYRQVESTSVTPFSARARDRALHAILVALARVSVPALASNDAAGNAPAHEAELRSLAEKIVRRVESVDRDEVDTTRSQLNEIIDLWLERARAGGLVYSNPRDPSKALLTDAAPALPGDAWPTLWSLRDVDLESKLYFVAEGVTA